PRPRRAAGLSRAGGGGVGEREAPGQRARPGTTAAAAMGHRPCRRPGLLFDADTRRPTGAIHRARRSPGVRIVLATPIIAPLQRATSLPRCRGAIHRARSLRDAYIKDAITIIRRPAPQASESNR